MQKSKFTSFQSIVLVTLMISSFMGRLDGTIINLALPKIISAFGITVSQASWIATAYIIANAIFVPIFGKLGDLIGRKPLYLFGIIGFTITSALAGLSFNLSSMIFFRILQAITVSIDYPLALSIIAVTFTDHDQRTQAMGLWSAVFAAASVFGPLLGGPLIDIFSWRSIFYINIPIGIIATLMAMKYIVEPVKVKKGIKNFDIVGSLSIGIFLGVLVLALNQGQVWGWLSTKSIISYVISIISLIVFLVVENRAKEPVVDLKFFKMPTFTASVITSFISFMGLMGGMFLIPIFAQDWLGFSVTKTGLMFIPMSIAVFAGAQTGARLSRKIQSRYIVAAGMMLGVIGMWFLSGIDIKWGFFDMAFRLMILAFGVGLGLAPLTASVTNSVPIQEVGIASSILALARNISGAFGTAIFATILSNSVSSNLVLLEQHSIINNVSKAVFAQIGFLMQVKANLLAYSEVFKVAVVVMAIGAISALFIKPVKVTKDSLEHQSIEL